MFTVSYLWLCLVWEKHCFPQSIKIAHIDFLINLDYGIQGKNATYIQRRERLLAWDRQESVTDIINGHSHVKAHGGRDCKQIHKHDVVYMGTLKLFGREEHIKKYGLVTPYPCSQTL